MANKQFFIFAVAAVCALQLCIAGKVPVNEPPAVVSIFDDLSQQTALFLKNLGTQVNEVVAAKDATVLQAIFLNSTQQFAVKVGDITKTLQQQLLTTNGEVAKVFNQVVANLNQTVTQLQTQNPEMSAKVKQVEENLQKSFKTVLGEADRIAKTVTESTKGIQEDVGKIVKKAYENILLTAQSLQKQLHEAANKN